MIIFKKISWSNIFSYGANNVINLAENQLTQIVGKNGHGKSSIALIIEEVLYNQNSKKIKKSDILNRYVSDKSYTIELVFEKDNIEYCIKTSRTNAVSNVKLFKSGLDISHHTATATYKAIEAVIGFDHKTFSQIVYQSSVSSLEFLTATDTTRKKFLIELLNLSIYTNASNVFKDLASEMGKKVDSIQSKIDTVHSWLTKYEKIDLTVKSLQEVPVSPAKEINDLALLNNQLLNIENTNKKIVLNNTYKSIVSTITIEDTVPEYISNEKIVQLKVLLENKIEALNRGSLLLKKNTGLLVPCITCGRDMDNSTVFNLAEQFKLQKEILEEDINKLKINIKQYETKNNIYAVYSKKLADLEKHYLLIDKQLPENTSNKQDLIENIKTIQEQLSHVNKSIIEAQEYNKKATEHNSKVSVISAQILDMRKELSEYSKSLVSNTLELSNLQILVKAFSTTGLVAYKIECLVKDLEELTNQYLVEFADGRFQLNFRVSSSDKLNVIITDNGYEVDILALSSGERARVNVATLLAIRKLMQTLSNSRTNLLILDETVENLDAEGKEKLIEVLLKEENLNTFLISHGFSHPLLEKLFVIKDNNISRIDNG